MEQTSVTPMHRETAADKTRNLTKMALCVAFLAISSYLAFPLPFTPAMVVGTTIIVNMTAFILKPNDAFLVVLAWPSRRFCRTGTPAGTHRRVLCMFRHSSLAHEQAAERFQQL